MVVVAALRIAPVKGLGTVPVQRAQLSVDGVAEDRRLWLLRADGRVATLRAFPQLAAVVPHLDLAEGTLAVRLPDGSVVTTALSLAGPAVTAELFGKPRPGRLLPGAAETALSSLAGEPLTLVYAEQPGVGWDEGPVSLLGRASAAAVGRADMERYRMLVELDGTAAYEEDDWVGHRVRLGEAVVEVVDRLPRCVVVERSPVTGAKDWEGLRTLAELRGRDLLCLGVIAQVLEPGAVAVGDAVEPLAPTSPAGLR